MNKDQTRPGLVIIAERLLWLSAVITALFTLTAYIGVFSLKIPGDAVISNLLTVAFLLLCAVKIGAGRNWARWLLLVVFSLGSLMLPVALVFAPQVVRSMPLHLVVVGFVQFAIQLAALILVFTPASKEWFRPAEGVAA